MTKLSELRRMHEVMSRFQPYNELCRQQRRELFGELQGLDAIIDPPRPSTAAREISRVMQSLSRLAEFGRNEAGSDPNELAKAAIATAYGELYGADFLSAIGETYEFFNSVEKFRKCAELAEEAMAG
jgi:hypothetical protein